MNGMYRTLSSVCLGSGSVLGLSALAAITCKNPTSFFDCEVTRLASEVVRALPINFLTAAALNLVVFVITDKTLPKVANAALIALPVIAGLAVVPLAEDSPWAAY